MGAIPAHESNWQAVVSSRRSRALWGLMSGYRLRYLAAAMSLGVGALSRSTTYLLLRFLVDEVLGKGRSDVGLSYIAIGFVGLAALEGGSTFVSSRLAAGVAERITVRLRTYLFDHIQRLAFAYHAHASTGELVSRCTSDVDAVRRFFADQAIGVGRIAMLFTVSLIVLLRLDSRLGLLSVSVIPLIVLLSWFFFGKSSKVYEAYQEQEARVSTVLQENLTGVRVVKAFARQDFERGKFDRENREQLARGQRLVAMHSLYWPVSDTLCGLQMLLGFLIGARMAIQGSISVGTYLAYAGLITTVIWPIRNLGRLIVQMSSGLVSLQRVLEVARQEAEPLEEGDYQPAAPIRGEIVFDGVGFEYVGGQRVLEGISLTCRPGQSVALLGSTGSGKTTLVNLLPRFYEYSSGSLTLDGVELKRYRRHLLREQIGIVEQEPFLFARSIRENIAYGVSREVDLAEIEDAARAAGVHDDIAGFPQGYDTVIGEKGVMLSGGQKQRIAIARTLLRDPRILILDDCTSSVDMETEQRIRAALQRLMAGRTTFVIAHRVQSLASADQIVVLDKGRIVQQGSHQDLMAQPGFYRKVHDLQAAIEADLEKEIAGV